MFWNSLCSTLRSVWETMHIHSHVMEVREHRELTKQLFPSGHVKRGHCRYGCSRQRHVCSSVLVVQKCIVSRSSFYTESTRTGYLFFFDRKERVCSKKSKKKKEIVIIFCKFTPHRVCFFKEKNTCFIGNENSKCLESK